MSDDDKVPINDESTRCDGSEHRTSTDHHVTCPWCGHVDEDTTDITLGDGDEEETECPRCERSFHLRVIITYTYDAYRPMPVKEQTP